MGIKQPDTQLARTRPLVSQVGLAARGSHAPGAGTSPPLAITPGLSFPGESVILHSAFTFQHPFFAQRSMASPDYSGILFL